MRVYLTHGKESGPCGTKMIALADIARSKGFKVQIPDYSDLSDPDKRVERLIDICGESVVTTVLVGSSMGGYVSTVASSIINPDGLFLMAPAFYLPDYNEQEPVPHSSQTVIVHGWNDDVVPVCNSIEFARNHGAELHLVNSDHRLISQLPQIKKFFALFLDEIIERSLIANGKIPKKLAWNMIANATGILLDTWEDCLEPYLTWLQRVWSRIEKQGFADYTNRHERIEAIVRLTALIDFFHEFIWGTERNFDWHDFSDESDGVELRAYHLSNLISQDDGVNHDEEQIADENLSLSELLQIYDHAIHNVVYPAIIMEFGNPAWVAHTLYNTLNAEWYGGDSDEFLKDPEEETDDQPPNIEDRDDYLAVFEWVKYKLTSSKNTHNNCNLL